MKKVFSILFIFTLFFSIIGCSSKNMSVPFADITWTRETNEDTETLCFSSDGAFSYYCSCGDSINDSDLCDSYSYDEKTETIQLNYSDFTENAVTTIKVISYSKKQLELNFAGEVRVFVNKSSL